MSEKSLQNKIMKLCKEKEVLCEKLESRSSRGWPDLFLLYEGRCVFLEIKNPNGRGRISPVQLRKHEDLILHGGWVFVVSEMVIVDTIIRSLIAGKR